MKIFKKLGKALILGLAVILFTTTIAFSGAQIEAKAATNEVSMYYADDVYYYRGYQDVIVYIKVKNLGANKNVAVHYNTGSSWTDEQATYVTTLSDGSEIWKCEVGAFGLEYAIKYTVNGVTYWDNNNANNYTAHNSLGVNPIKNLRTSYYGVTSYSAYPIRAEVKNLSFTKIINVRYTQDNWATSSTKSLIYNSSVSNGTEELWDTTLSLDANKMSGFQYYVYYQANGQTYYDNNFGSNYNNSYYSPF